MAAGTPNASGALDPLLGTTVGNWRLERKIGEGGMGAVYFLRHVRLRNNVAAMKVLRSTGERETARIRMRERFDQEALVADAIGSHRVVKPLDMGDLPDGTPYFIMEYVDGRSLERELAAVGPLPVEAALLIAFRVADTLVAAHDKGIIHRDLKPANLMLVGQIGGGDFQVKLLDFGVARASGEIKLAQTADNMIVGTPGYMSPESVTGAAIDGRVDVFALGVVLFEMLTGTLPFPAPTVAAAFTSVLSSPPLPLAAHRPGHLDPVPAEVVTLVHRTLEKDAARRGTMDELRRALADSLQRLGATSPGRGGAQAVTLLAHLDERIDEAPTNPDRTADPSLFASVAPTRVTPQHSSGERPTVISAPERRPSKRRWVLGLLALAVMLGGIGLLASGTWGPTETAHVSDMAQEVFIAPSVPDLAIQVTRIIDAPPPAPSRIDPVKLPPRPKGPPRSHSSPAVEKPEVPASPPPAVEKPRAPALHPPAPVVAPPPTPPPAKKPPDKTSPFIVE